MKRLSSGHCTLTNMFIHHTHRNFNAAVGVIQEIQTKKISYCVKNHGIISPTPILNGLVCIYMYRTVRITRKQRRHIFSFIPQIIGDYNVPIYIPGSLKEAMNKTDKNSLLLERLYPQSKKLTIRHIESP